MPAISYSKQNIELYHFDKKILQEIKIHTIRRYRKRPFKLDDILYQYAMQRNKNGYKITENICLYVADIKIILNDILFKNYDIKEICVFINNKKIMSQEKLNKLAKNDGFDYYSEFRDYFIKSGLPFRGQIIGWKEGISYE